MTDLDGHDVWSLEGAGYFSAQTIHGASCLQQTHRHGSVTDAQQMLGAAMVQPDGREVLPWMPAPIVHQEGTDNNDGERTAAKRLLAQWRQEHPHLQFIVTDDRLSSTAPHLEVLQDHDLHDILDVKAGDHALLFEPVQVAEHAGGVTDDERHDRAAGVVHRVRWVNDVPLNESNPAVQVPCIESWERGQAKVQLGSWVTDRRVSTRHVYRLMRGGRAWWTIANETFKTLKNQGDNFEHHDGHGEPHLSVVFARGMRLAFLGDQTQQRCGALFQAGWAKLGSKRLLWERMRAWFDDDALASMRQLFEALLYGCKKSSPLGTMDASSSASIASTTTWHRTR